MAKTQELDAELRELWSRRRDLDEPGWTRLFDIVKTVLRGYRPPELLGLPEERDVYILEFIEDKVWRLDLLSRCDHVGALRVYFVRYLRDQLRSNKIRPEVGLAEEHNSESESSRSLEEAPDFSADEENPLVELEEAGFPPAEVAKSAAAWLASREEWVRLFVALSNCPDAELSEPLVRLAKRKGIKSYAYRAEKLGFNWNSDDMVGFGDKMIGRWIVESLHIKILPENKGLIHGALKILCFEALSWVEQQKGVP